MPPLKQPVQLPRLGEGYLTVKDYAASVGLSPDRIRQFIREGRLAAVETPYGRLVLPGAEIVRRPSGAA